MDKIIFSKKSNNTSLDVLSILRMCKEEKISQLTFPKDIYKFQATYCEQRLLKISNHGLNGDKRISVLVEGMDNFVIDFNGSTITTEDELIPLVIKDSSNITIKNAVIDSTRTKTIEMQVVETTNDFIKVKVIYGKEDLQIIGNKIWSSYGREYLYARQDTCFEFNGETGEIEYGTGDCCLGSGANLTYEDIGDGYLLIRGFTITPPVGNIIVSHIYCRCACGVLVDGSKNIRLENVTINSSYGMGLLAQFSENISLNSFNTKRSNGRMHTCNADATHFVCCKGLVDVENCSFEGQLDDALNIHGIYLRVLDKIGDNKLMLKLMHCQATGLPVFEKGDTINAVNVNTLLPYSTNTIQSVEYINDEILIVTLKEKNDDIQVGDDIENITKSPELIFRNNIVKNNRARGMLIACKGKAIIENNYFHTAGASILFESDGEWWFESGGTKEVYILNNHFDRCKHGTWGNFVIEFAKRKETQENKYYHEKIVVKDNKFTLFNDSTVKFDNINSVEFSSNIIENGTAVINVTHCNNVKIEGENIIIK